MSNWKCRAVTAERSVTGVRVLVCGGRDFQDTEMLGSCLGGIRNRYGISAIIEGGAPGADTLARLFGAWAAIPVESYPADWKRYGKAAGPIRNQRMLDEGKPDMVVAFPGGRGTADMVRRASAAGIEIWTAVNGFNAEQDLDA